HPPPVSPAGTGPRQDDPRETQPLEPSEAGRTPVPVSVHDKLSARMQSRVGDRIHVPDDDVGPVARLDERVRAAIDTDEDRAILAEIRPQRSEVFAVVVTANDDQEVVVL